MLVAAAVIQRLDWGWGTCFQEGSHGGWQEASVRLHVGLPVGCFSDLTGSCFPRARDSGENGGGGGATEPPMAQAWKSHSTSTAWITRASPRWSKRACIPGGENHEVGDRSQRAPAQCHNLSAS